MDKRADWLRLTQKKEAINFRLGRDQLTGPDEMILKKTQINRIQKAISTLNNNARKPYNLGG